jgi:hypothetical protein
MMHTRSLSMITLAAGLGMASTAWAQLELPQPSPSAKVSQRVGLTDIAVWTRPREASA